MIAERLINPYALTHLPCNECGKSAEEINREPIFPGGAVQYEVYSKYVGAIVGRRCTACAIRVRGERAS
jgi:hypothetical protein